MDCVKFFLLEFVIRIRSYFKHKLPFFIFKYSTELRLFQVTIINFPLLNQFLRAIAPKLNLTLAVPKFQTNPIQLLIVGLIGLVIPGLTHIMAHYEVALLAMCLG